MALSLVHVLERSVGSHCAKCNISKKNENSNLILMNSKNKIAENGIPKYFWEFQMKTLLEEWSFEIKRSGGETQKRNVCVKLKASAAPFKGK